MNANVGNVDRAIRVVLGVALLSLLVLLEGNIRWVGLLGLVMLGTAAIRFCPLYPVIGLNTCQKP
ncbi:MAG TPA: DUF2892 domain-containing protein [Pseudomonadales bacterium]|nr:DUF2892 domain-containing protein [Pseudomonadales bacterium]